MHLKTTRSDTDLVRRVDVNGPQPSWSVRRVQMECHHRACRRAARQVTRQWQGQPGTSALGSTPAGCTLAYLNHTDTPPLNNTTNAQTALALNVKNNTWVRVTATLPHRVLRTLLVIRSCWLCLVGKHDLLLVFYSNPRSPQNWCRVI